MIKKRLLLMLAVDIQQQRGKLAQSRDRRGLVVDVETISFVERYLTPDDELTRFGVEAEPFEMAAEIHFENGFHDGPAFSGTHHFRRRLGSGKQSECVHDDGFSGTR